MNGVYQHDLLQPGADSRRNWKQINRQGLSLESLWLEVQRLQALVADLRPMPAPRFLHPFQIYSLPLRESAAPTTDWRTVRVHAGTVFVDWTEAAATGTDGVANPDVMEVSSSGDIICAATTAKHWIWLDLTAGAAAVNNSATAPTWANNKIPLGWVDTNSYASEKRIVIRQFIRSDFFACL